ncbi:MAG TPA: glycosyltransferase family 4 protein [Cyclobacteriaceae bacterium]|jgi:colanic acid/amylovoran biosynthesis glycosyltransferase|nr:glycosyltransferase family 4 protein [Cytophagales bacterium]HNT50048.1 glycosyltransferase family 4 protein [Cyclobacteriaceae bacterium]HRE65863.1 glycosyltransferase family 4 protein [Cyclobacteriaceae bacterium]HRF33707.1 glycosyltransferase family 4 protein [Cyclobacteriaceae bacterium]
MMPPPKVKVLFYHAHFFNSSETFIYQQVINPYIEPLLLAKRFINSTGMSSDPFNKIQFKRTWWDGLISNVLIAFGIDRYYQNTSIKQLTEKISKNKPDVLHAQFGFSAVRILPVAKKLKLPLIVSFHGMDASHMLRKRPYVNGLKDVFVYAAAIVVCNPAMTEVLPLTPEQKQKVVWVPYGINLGQFDSQPRIESKSVSILHVGRLIEKKGVPDLILAFAKLTTRQQVLLHVVGTGPEEEKCKQLVETLNLKDRVIFHGWKSPDEVKNLMQQADVFVLNSRVASNGDSEGLPVGILEAMTMELPVVSTYHAGIPYEVDHQVTGLLVQEKDTGALANALTVLVEDTHQRKVMGAAGRIKAETYFSMEKMHASLQVLYKRAQSS